MLRPRCGSIATSKVSWPIFRFVAERPSDGFQQVGGEDFLGFHGHRAGLDLRKVENVADQVQQVGAGAVNGAGEFDLLVGQVAVGVLGQLLARESGCC